MVTPARRLQNSSNHRVEDAPYTSEFFDNIRNGSLRSAQVVVPIAIELARPKSVVDVGCGDGTWLSVFRHLGVNDTLGLDGDYVNREQLQIPQDQFRPTDLSQPFALPRTFDLAISLEVAEHLPPQSAEGFIKSLTQLAQVVLFSAAIPLQGGTQHLNEQWPQYWAALFKTHNYLPIDRVRGRIWANEQVEWWYAQNGLLFASEDRLRKDPILQLEYEKTYPDPLALVHPKRFLQSFECGVPGAFRLLMQTTINAVKRRF